MYLFGIYDPQKDIYGGQKLRQRNKVIIFREKRWYILNAPFGKMLRPGGVIRIYTEYLLWH